jgi:Tol biopolymer transport system component
MGKRSHLFDISRLQDKHLYVILAGICLVSRLPFLKTFELVAYDGTYYLNQAKTLFSGHMAGSFPIGYPLVVRLFQFVLRDYQLAGMAVSFAAAVGSTIVLYLLARHFVRRELALLAALTMALNPLSIRLSLSTLSEATYIFWMLLGLLMFVRSHWVRFGLFMGIATITRPEAIAIAGLLGLGSVRTAGVKKLSLAAACFLAVFAVNSLVLSLNTGRVVILPKSEFLGSSTAFWKMREASIQFQDKDQTYEEMAAEVEPASPFADYLARLPRETGLLIKCVLPAVFLLALFSLRRRKYLFLVAALVPFFVFPLATVRSIDRYILPFAPILVLMAVLAIGDLGNRAARAIAIGLVVITIVVSPVLNRAALLEPEEPDLLPAKKAGLQFRDKVNSGDRIADRKPFFAFYAGGKYVEIPVAPYEDMMNYFTREQDVKYLCLHLTTIHRLRPALRPMLYSQAVLNGELRFRQVYFDPEGIMVLQRIAENDPLSWSRLTPPGGDDYCPAWSPDGNYLAFRTKMSDGTGGIYMIDTRQQKGSPPRKVAETPAVYDQLSWSPDGRAIAFASDASGRMELKIVDVESGAVRNLDCGEGANMSPSWSPAGDEIFFSSDRTGVDEVWVVNVNSGAKRQISTDGGNTRPAVSPAGDQVAWIKQDTGVVIYHGPSGRSQSIGAPRRVRYAPTWSPDGRYLAVTAEDWGSWDIYLFKADGTNALLLTKNHKRDAMPVWSPDGSRIALISDVDQKKLSIWTIEGLEPYLQRLEAHEKFQVFKYTANP